MIWGHLDPYGSKTAIEQQTFDGSLSFWTTTEIFNPPLEWSSRWLGDYISSILAKVMVVESQKYQKRPKFQKISSGTP